MYFSNNHIVTKILHFFRTFLVCSEIFIPNMATPINSYHVNQMNVMSQRCDQNLTNIS